MGRGGVKDEEERGGVEEEEKMDPLVEPEDDEVFGGGWRYFWVVDDEVVEG
jgi:hypothetical protein